MLINFNAEYDALPGIGHACGHNLIATSSIVAFLALSALLKKYGIAARTQLLGTPAEENGGGKEVLIEKGAYKGVDISLMAYVLPFCLRENIYIYIHTGEWYAEYTITGMAGPPRLDHLVMALPAYCSMPASNCTSSS